MEPANLESGFEMSSLTGKDFQRPLFVLANETDLVLATPQIPKMNILALPSELQLEIFSYLDPVSSTCFGLSCKRFYAIHVHNTTTKKNDKVSLEAWVILPASRLSGRHLFELLGDWMPPGLAYSPSKLKFIDKQVLEEDMKAMSARDRSFQAHAAEMRCVQQKAKAWKEEGGWYEGGVWQILYVPRRR
jgi:hypothetical protein